MTNIVYFPTREELRVMELQRPIVVMVDRWNRHAIAKRCPFAISATQLDWVASFERHPKGLLALRHVEGQPVYMWYCHTDAFAVELVDELHAEHAHARWLIALKEGSAVDEHVRRSGRHIEALAPPPVEPPTPKLTKQQREQRRIDRECRAADRRFWAAQRAKPKKRPRKAKKKASKR